ncbi:MAG: hypothetical protein PVG66_16080 [Chromatiales bacterium]
MRTLSLGLFVVPLLFIWVKALIHGHLDVLALSSGLMFFITSAMAPSSSESEHR